MKKFIIEKRLIVLMVVVCIVAFIVLIQLINVMNRDQLSIAQNEQVTSYVIQPKVSSITYTNQFLPSFKIDYPNSWELDERRDDTVERGCQNDCLGLDLKKNEQTIRLNFRIFFDDNVGTRCTNEISFDELSNGWIRINDFQNGIFYTQNFEKDYYISQSVTEWESGQKVNEGWTIESGTYKLCIYGSGMPLKGRSFLKRFPEQYPEGVGIMMRRPYIIGNPSQKELMEIDQIISSIETGY